MVIAPVQENSGKQEKGQRERKKEFRGGVTDSFSDSKHKGTSGREIFTILLKKSEKYDCGFIFWSIDVNRKCLSFKKYCKYDIFRQKMLRKVEIGRLHKWIVEMWIIQSYAQKLSTCKNMEKP